MPFRAICAVLLLVVLGWTTIAAGDEAISEQIASLIKDLESPKSEKRIVAADALRKLGRDAAPATTALCWTVVTHTGTTRSAAMEALKAVVPDLYVHIEEIEEGRVAGRGLTALTEAGKDAAPALPIVLAFHKRLQTKIAGRDMSGTDRVIVGTNVSPFAGAEEQSLKAIAALAPSDPKTWPAYIVTLRPATVRGQVVPKKSSVAARLLALQGITRLAEANPELAPKAVKELRSQLADQSICLEVMGLLPRLGVEAKSALPELRKLRTSAVAEIREAATGAIDKIESAKP